jgi:hypothetical protein
MSRTFFIGLVAALAVLVSACAALGAPARPHNKPSDDGAGGPIASGCVAGGRPFDRTHLGVVATRSFTLSTIGCSSLRATPKGCIESISTKYTLFLPAVAPSLAGGDTATHEGWQAHQACARS